MFKQITRIATVIAIIGAAVLATGCGGDEGINTRMPKYIEKAEATACKDTKIVSASQTTKTNAYTDPVNGLLITCEDGSLVWIK